MDYHDNPLLKPAFAGHVPTLPSTYSAQPEPRKSMVPPIVGEIIGKLGLRYRPSGQADLEAHAEALALLSEDCADVPPALLDRAAKSWARSERFMPRAAELLQRARDLQKTDLAGTDYGAQKLMEYCAELNERELRMGRSVRWQVVGKAPNRSIATLN